MDALKFNILHTQGPNGGEIFGPWFESFGKILRAKSSDGVYIDTWKEGTSYKIVPHSLDEESAFTHFARIAIRGTIAEIFDNRESFKIEKLYVPYVLIGNKMIAVNNNIQTLKAQNISDLIATPMGVPVLPLDHPEKFEGRFLSTDISFHDMQVIVNNYGGQLSDTPEVIFMPIWRISFTVEGTRQQFVLLETGNNAVYQASKFPLDNRLSKPAPITKPFFESLFSLLFIIIFVILGLGMIFGGNSIDNMVFLLPLLIVVAIICIYAASYIGVLIDLIVNKAKTKRSQTAWKLYAQNNINHKLQTLKNKFGIAITSPMPG